MGVEPVEFEVEQQVLARHVARQRRGSGARARRGRLPVLTLSPLGRHRPDHDQAGGQVTDPCPNFPSIAENLVERCLITLSSALGRSAQ